MDKKELIDAFKKNYKHISSIECGGKLIDTYHKKVHDCPISTRSGIKTLVKVCNVKNFLEIGSYHYETSNQVALTMDEMYGKENLSIGHVDSFDIRKGGYDGNINCVPQSKRISARYWLPHKTHFLDGFKYEKNTLALDGFLEKTDEEIKQYNLEVLSSIKPTDGYDMVYIDGDHSFEGAQYDFEYAMEVCSKNAILIIDDIWDDRLLPVRRFYDTISLEKWDFSDWNDANQDKVQNMGIVFVRK